MYQFRSAPGTMGLQVSAAGALCQCPAAEDSLCASALPHLIDAWTLIQTHILNSCKKWSYV